MTNNARFNAAAIAEQARYDQHIADLRDQLARAAGDQIKQANRCVTTLQSQGETLIFALCTAIRIFDKAGKRR